MTGPDDRSPVVMGQASTLAPSSTIEPVSTRTPLIVGQRVRVAEWVRPQRFAGREGVVVNFVEGEVGVRLGKPGNHPSNIWFRPSELEVRDSASRAPRKPANRGGGHSPTPGVSGRSRPRLSRGRTVTGPDDRILAFVGGLDQQPEGSMSD